MLRVATHSGTFHADDVFAIAVLRLAHPDGVEVVRTRDRAVQEAADVRVDVGHVYDPEAGTFDHHQKGGAGERSAAEGRCGGERSETGIPYASFGLVWRHYGPGISERALPRCAEDLLRGIDHVLVKPIDANDVGVQLVPPREDALTPYAVSALIAALNPSWDEPHLDEDAQFDRAVDIAQLALEREIARQVSSLRARARVEEAIASRDGEPRLLELDEDLPWIEPVVEGAPDVLFVIYPKSDGFGLRAVPRALGDFANRKDLPASWAGLEGEALAQVTGVPDAVFCHLKRFVAVARTREGVLALARQALAD